MVLQTRMWAAVLLALLVIGLVISGPVQASPPEPDAETLFEKGIRPLLADRCFGCHGEQKQAGRLRVDSREALLMGGKSGPAINTESSEKSLLLAAVRGEPGSSATTPQVCNLEAKQVAVLVAWLKAGAVWPDSGTAVGGEASANLWSFLRVADPPVPEVNDESWPTGPLDRFVLAQLEKRALRPVGRADRRTLIRRATYDLTGLPPTPAEVVAFLADKSPNAFAHVVERLLASPRYGERWGRHWLDVARYADSNGLDENLSYANAFRYRDYVVAAFNKDKPYDQFVREQIAGDLMPVPGDQATTIERQIATAFLAIGGKMLAEDDPVKMQMDIIDEQIDTMGKAFWGMTLGCARCHEHKFDPISTEDYYALAGIFKSTKTMENFKVVAVWYERPVAGEKAITEHEAHLAKAAEAKAKVDALVKQANEQLLAEARTHVAEYLLAGSSLNRQRTSLSALRVVEPSSDGAQPDGLILLEAEDYARGNVNKDFETYGQGIGVLVNRGELPNFAEYDVTVARDETYQLQFRYAAAESRPGSLSIDGKLVKSDAVAQITGSWTPESQTWSVEGVFALQQGKNTIRLQRNGPFSHVDKLLLVPRRIAGGQALIPKTAEQIAREYGVNPALLRQWAEYLKRTQDNSESFLAGWHTFEKQARAFLEAESADGASQVFEGLVPDWRNQLARRYAELFNSNERFQQALNGPEGPFTVPMDAAQYYPEATAAKLKQQREQVSALEEEQPKLPQAMGVTEGQVADIAVHLRGSHLNLGMIVPRHFPVAMAGAKQAPLPDDQSGRLQLAQWMTTADHRLTSRVMANRIWRWHFGRGLVTTPDNFGATGTPPTHPALLDWLAKRFVESGWSIKEMHRLIMSSATYQMASNYDAASAAIDPENQWLWRRSKQRLEAEAIRDTILSVAGTLDLTMGGSRLKVANHAYVTSSGSSLTDEYDTTRRSLYVPVVRSDVHDALETFDFPDPTASSGDRSTTTVAPQALLLLNSPFVAKQSTAMAERLLGQATLDDPGRIALAYETAYSRPPTEAEAARAFEFITRYTHKLQRGVSESPNARLRAWQSLCRVLIASNEFVYID